MAYSVQKTPRNSAIELLRIIAIIMIIFHHFAIYGGFTWEVSSVTIPYLWYNLIIMGGKIGINLFVLISGYYLIQNTDTAFDMKRIIKFWGQIFFYSIVIAIVFLLMGENLGIKYLIKSCFPITFAKWGFASTYFVLYLSHPFLNKLLHSLDKWTYQKLVILLLFCWSFIPTITNQDYQGNTFLWLVTLYIIAGYIRLYGINPKFTNRGYWLGWLAASVATYSCSIIMSILSSKYEVLASYTLYFFGQEKVNVLIVSVAMFMAFITIKMNYRRGINFIAGATFGVYLIHENDLIRSLLWNRIFVNSKYQESLLLIPYSLLVVGGIFVVCTVIDLLRKYTIEKTFMLFVNKFAENWVWPWKKIVGVFSAFIFGE